MNPKTLSIVAGVLTALASAAHAQSTLGDLLERGALKLATTAEVQALGDLRVFRATHDSDAYMTMRSDGMVIGMVHNREGHGSSEAIGSWKMDDGGRRCADVALPAFNMNWTQCGYTFRLGQNIFFASSDSDLGAPVTAYTGSAYLVR
jgi:hypothetical protein